MGRSDSGELGDGTTVDKSSPVQVGALTTWADISRGNRFVIGRTTGNTLFSWGDNDTGMLGLGDTTDRSSPVQVGALTTWNKSAGEMSNALHSVAFQSS